MTAKQITIAAASKIAKKLGFRRAENQADGSAAWVKNGRTVGREYFVKYAEPEVVAEVVAEAVAPAAEVAVVEAPAAQKVAVFYLPIKNSLIVATAAEVRAMAQDERENAKYNKPNGFDAAAEQNQADADFYEMIAAKKDAAEATPAALHMAQGCAMQAVEVFGSLEAAIQAIQNDPTASAKLLAAFMAKQRAMTAAALANPQAMAATVLPLVRAA